MTLSLEVTIVLKALLTLCVCISLKKYVLVLEKVSLFKAFVVVTIFMTNTVDWNCLASVHTADDNSYQHGNPLCY